MTRKDNNKQNVVIDNLELITRTKGQDRLRRHELFVEDGCGGLWTTDTGSPIVIRGKQR